MIHIDDLVRQKLGGAEEKERSGAWLRMKDLLDKEMPASLPVGGFKWKKIYSAALLLLSLSMLGGGSYVAFERQKQADVLSASRNKPTASPAILNSEGTSKNEANNPVIAHEKIETIYAHAEPVVVNAAKHSASHAKMKSNNLKANVPSKAEFAPVTADVSATTSVRSQPNLNGIRNVADYQTADGQQASVNKKASYIVSSSATPTARGLVRDGSGTESVAGDKSEPARRSPLAENVAPTGKNRAHTNTVSSKSEHQGGRKSETLSGMSAPGKLTATRKVTRPKNGYASSSHPVTAVRHTDSEGYTLFRDTFSKITLRKKYHIDPITRASYVHSDTISVELVSIDKWVPDAKADLDAMRKGLSSSKSPASPDNAVMVPLSSKVVKSKKISRFNMDKFQDIVRDAKFSLNQVRFYPGITGGINSSLFGSSGLKGFQFGLSSLFTFGEHWGASADVKFFQRLGGNSLDDRYYQYGTGATGLYQKPVDHYFKFSGTRSIELPVTLRYSWGRLSAFTGINVVYNLAINAEEVTIVKDSTVYITPAFNQVNSSPSISINDFQGSFTGGCLLGMNYQLTPALGLDLRANQNVWNSGKTEGAKKVYNLLYNSPSLQFSVYYRFRNNSKYLRAQ